MAKRTTSASTSSDDTAKITPDAADKAVTSVQSAMAASTKTPSKTTPKKPPVKRSSNKTPAKTASSKKSAAKKTPAKRASPRATATAKPKPKSTAKPKAKSTAKTKTTAKTATNPKPATATKPRTVAALHGYLDKTADRLSRAHTKNARAIATLDDALKALERVSAEKDKSRADQLRRRLKEMRSDLSTLSADIRAATRADLKEMMAADGPQRLQILDQINARVAQSEAERASQMARLNTHLAELARTVDTRLTRVEQAQTRETEARLAGVTKIVERVDGVEAETAQAISNVGERMVALATSLREDIEALRSAPDTQLTSKLDDLAARTQSDFASMRESLVTQVSRAERMANTAQSEAKDVARRQEGAISELNARLDSLEYMLSQNLFAAPAAPLGAPARAESNIVAMTPPATKPLSQNPVASKPLSSNSSAPTPVSAPATAQTAGTPDRPAHYPVEYVPSASASAATATAQARAPHPYGTAMMGVSSAAISQTAPAPAQAPAPAPAPAPTSIPQPDFAGVTGHVPMPALDPSVVPQITDADLPFVNPGYAETGARPADFAEGAPSVLDRLKGRNGRVIALTAGVVVAGILAVRAISGGPDAPASAPVDASSNVTNARPAATASSGLGLVTTPPIGDTSALNVPSVPVDSPAANSLQAAVEAGNPIAQYQAGLMEVERGNLDTAIDLVRKAADQGLPAAQYRLAKFYEYGQGVPLDINTAARLTQRAALQGHRIAMHDTGLFFAEGHLGESGQPDQDMAMDWFEKAARLGVVDSQFNLAYLFDNGQNLGVTRDAIKSYAWFAIASQSGDQQAAERMDRLKAELSPEQLATAEARIAAFSVQPMDEAANGIFRDLPWAPAITQTAQLDKSSVSQIQSMLNELGYDTGTPDGMAGPKTREAIMAYERARALPQTGTPSRALLQSLSGDTGA